MSSIPPETRDNLIKRVKDADILFVPIDGYRMAPARVRAYNFARELQRRGVRAEVVSFVDHVTALDDVPLLPRNNWPSMDRYNLRKVLDLAEILQQNPKCPIVAQKADLNLFALGMANAANGNKLILDYDDNDTEVFSVSHRLAHAIDDFHPRRLLQHFAERVTCCIASSNELHTMLHSYNRHTHLVYTVVDTTIFDFTLRGKMDPPIPVNRDMVNIVWPGSVWNQEMMQDVVLMAEAFLCLPAQVRAKAKLHFFGFGHAWPTACSLLQKMAAERNASDSITLHDSVPPDVMPAIYANMDIGLICLQQNSYTRAKSPTKMFEYMAMGLAVCASSGGEPGRILEDGVTGCVAHSLSQYQERLSHLILDQAFRQRVADNGRALVNTHYSMQVAGDQLMSILKPLMVA